MYKNKLAYPIKLKFIRFYRKCSNDIYNAPYTNFTRINATNQDYMDQYVINITI